MAQKPGSPIKLVTNVSEFGLFTSLARSRLRLVIAVIVGNAAMFGLSWWVADFVMNTSASVGLNLVLIALTMLSLLACSYLEAMLVGDLFFGGRWRERVLLNQRLEIDPDSPEGIDVGHFKTHNLTFLIVVAVLIIANYFGTNAVTGDYLGEYHELGFQLTQLRDDDPEAKLHAYQELTKPIYKHLWNDPRVVASLRKELDSGHPELEQWAAWGAGQMSLRSLYEPLLARMTDTHATTATRGAAAIALGKLRDPRAWPALQAFLQQNLADEPLTIDALRAIAVARAPEFGEQVRPLVKDPRPLVRAYAFYALQQLADPDAHDMLLAIYKNGEPQDRCGALEALKFIATHDDVQHLKDTFVLLADDDPSCQEVLWIEPNDTKHKIIWNETHRVKLLKAVWNASHGDETEWYATLAMDKQMVWPVRAQAADLIAIAKHEAGK